MAPPRRLAAVLAQLGAPSDRRCAPSLRGSSAGSSSVAHAEHCPVSADDVAFFRANGYLLVKSLVPPSEPVDVDRDPAEMWVPLGASPFRSRAPERCFSMFSMVFR